MHVSRLQGLRERPVAPRENHTKLSPTQADLMTEASGQMGVASDQWCPSGRDSSTVCWQKAGPQTAKIAASWVLPWALSYPTTHLLSIVSILWMGTLRGRGHGQRHTLRAGSSVPDLILFRRLPHRPAAGVKMSGLGREEMTWAGMDEAGHVDGL